MRPVRTRRQVALVAPRPLRVTRCSITTRDELVAVLDVLERSHECIYDSDGKLAVDSAALLLRTEPELPDHISELQNAAALGAAIYATCEGSAAGAKSTGTKYVDILTWNSLAWAGIEASYRLPARLGSFADYFVRVGHFFAAGGLDAIREVERELGNWCKDYSRQRATDRNNALLDGQPIGEFWVDQSGEVQGMSSLPQRPAASPERLYDELIFDLAWDDFCETAVGVGRPRRTRRLPHVAPIEWAPPLQRRARPNPVIDLRDGDAGSKPVNGSRKPRVPSPDPNLALIFGDGGAVNVSTAVLDRTTTGEVPIPQGAQVDYAPPPAAVPIAAAPPPATAPIAAAPPVVTAPEGWFDDPLRRFVYRWWNGSEWTGHVSNGGVTGTDPHWRSSGGS